MQPINILGKKLEGKIAYFNFLNAWARLTTVGSHISLKEDGTWASVFSNHHTAFLYLKRYLKDKFMMMETFIKVSKVMSFEHCLENGVAKL